MTSIHYPGTEPIRLKFSSLNPTQTSIFDAGPPSPPIVFRSLRSSRSFFTTSSFQASNGTADWTDIDNVLGLHVLGEIDPDAESTVLHGPASTESTTSSSPAAASSMAPPLYVVFTEPSRARWLRRRKTYIARGSGGQLVATIRWPSTNAGKVIGSGAELSRGVGGSVKLESWRKWARERWRGIRKPEDDRAVVVQDTRGRRYVWMLTETAPEDTTGDDFKLKLIPADQSLPHIRDEDSMAVLEFTDGLESPPASSIHPRKPRLDHALLTLRAHDQSGSRLQELLDLAVISVIFALTRCSYRLCMQEYIPPPEPPPIPRLGTPRLLSPLDLRGISSFGLPTHPSIPDVESQLSS